jgi:TonB family protein
MPIFLALALTFAGTAQQPFPAPVPPVTFGPMPGEAPELLLLRAREARCGRRFEQPTFAEQPLPVLVASGRSLVGTGRVLRLTFRIDQTGRPLSISEPSGLDTVFTARVSDVVPAFATWRFAPGAARTDCEVNFGVEFVPVAEASLSDLHRVLILGQASGPPRQAAWNRTLPAGSTCFSPGPSVRVQAFPDWESIPQPPGTASYSLVGFDIDRSGRPTNVRIAGSSGNAALDRQSLGALRRSRYAPEARRGCTFPYWRRPTQPVAAPPMPAEDTFRPADATCRRHSEPWASQPQQVFPPTLERRRLEGWAVLSYDVAPWGEVGNVRVLAAEPAARFGTHAVNLMRTARQNPGVGGTGCTYRFRFLLPRGGQSSPVAAGD